MTAILDIDVLRAHAVSAITPTGFGAASAPVPHRQTNGSRPVLVARWRVRPDGHLTCHWESETSAAFGVPPD
ncbi:MAG TPA: hypothetical protein VHU42_02140 [Rhodopila sp.]|nr:hypothetical protein [Rhodopila sp.]